MVLGRAMAMEPSAARAQPAPTPQPTAQPAPEDARVLFDRGTTLYALGRYADAAPLFERAFELKPDPALLYNAAQAHRLAGHSQRALTLYQSYLQLYGDTDRQTEIEARIRQLKDTIAAERRAALPSPSP